MSDRKSFFTKLKEKTNSCVFGILKSFVRLVQTGRNINNAVSNCAVSIVGVIVSVFLCQPRAQEIVLSIKNLDALFIAIGGLIGTMIALVLSISLIPIQAAAESFTSSVVRLYRDDRVTRYMFAILSIFCLASFLMTLSEVFGYQKSLLLPLAVLFIAFSLDLLRWHHRHIILQLGSNERIGELSEKVKKFIKLINKRITFLSRIRWIFLSRNDKKQLSLEKIEQSLASEFYRAGSLRVWIDEFSEIAHKAIVRREALRAQLAIFALSDIACFYLSLRKHNLRLYPEMEALGTVSGSDVNDVLTPIYEHYKNICTNAIDQKVENAAINVVQALGRIANCLTTLNAKAYREHSAPLTYLPVGYIGSCVEMSQRNGLDDVALQGNDILLNIVKVAPRNISIVDIHLSILKELNKIATTFLIKGNSALSNRCVGNMMNVAHISVMRKHFAADNIVRELTNNLYTLMVSATLQEKISPSPFLGQPLIPAYDLTQQTSIGYLVARAEDLIEKPDKDRVNPYHQFIEFNEPIRRHFYSLGEKLDFGSNFMLWHLIHTIKYISKVFLKILIKQVTNNPDHINQLLDCYKWYLSFFWLAFSKKSTIHFNYAEEATDTLACIGLDFYNLGHKDTMRACIDNIAVIAKEYRNIMSKDTSQGFSLYNVVDIMMPIWQIRTLMEARGEEDFIKQIDEKMAMFTESKEIEEYYKEPLETRKRQFLEELREATHFSESDKAIGVLKRLLQDNQVKA